MLNKESFPALKKAYKQLTGCRRRIKYHNARVVHDHKLIFIHIPKAAGSSITNTLNQLPRDTENLSPKIGKHAKAWEVRFLLGHEIWDQYFSFAFVRNPWDLMVSSYHWWLQKAVNMPQYSKHVRRIQNMGSFYEFMHSVYGQKMINERHGGLYDWISDPKTGELLVDFVGKVEQIEEDWQEICKRANINAAQIGHDNRTDRSNYREYYDDETKKIVARRFRRTIEKFGYEF